MIFSINKTIYFLSWNKFLIFNHYQQLADGYIWHTWMTNDKNISVSQAQPNFLLGCEDFGGAMARAKENLKHII
jgi:hypothetical protein